MALIVRVDFAIPETKDIGPCIVGHFSQLGYRLTNERPNEWVFQRGKKSATLWRFDIRAYSTTLTVQMAPQEDSQVSISCDWEVYTFLTITTDGDVATLESEGHALESVLMATT